MSIATSRSYANTSIETYISSLSIWQRRLIRSPERHFGRFCTKLDVRTNLSTLSDLSTMECLLEWLMKETCQNPSLSTTAPSRDVCLPLCFSIFFYAAMLLDAFRSNNKGIHIKYRTDGGIFNLQRLRSKSKVIDLLAHDLLYADDCALAAHKLEDAQTIVDCFAKSAARFGLSMNIKKTEVVQQPYQPHESLGSLHVDNVPLNNVDRFCYHFSRCHDGQWYNGKNCKSKSGLWATKTTSMGWQEYQTGNQDQCLSICCYKYTTLWCWGLDTVS